MIPDFDERGYLPPGVHPATMEEIEARLGSRNRTRRHQMDSLRWLIPIAVRAGVKRVVINGSFVTKKAQPGDVDCALLIGSDYPLDPAADAELKQGLPYLQLEVVNAENFD